MHLIQMLQPFAFDAKSAYNSEKIGKNRPGRALKKFRPPYCLPSMLGISFLVTVVTVGGA